jgi:hypothetical protein
MQVVYSTWCNPGNDQQMVQGIIRRPNLTIATPYDVLAAINQEAPKSDGEVGHGIIRVNEHLIIALDRGKSRPDAPPVPDTQEARIPPVMHIAYGRGWVEGGNHDGSSHRLISAITRFHGRGREVYWGALMRLENQWCAVDSGGVTPVEGGEAEAMDRINKTGYLLMYQRQP